MLPPPLLLPPIITPVLLWSLVGVGVGLIYNAGRTTTV
jgi:hypothetical protein